MRNPSREVAFYPLFLLALLACRVFIPPAPTATSTPALPLKVTLTLTPSQTLTPSPTRTPSPTLTPTASRTQTITPLPSETPTPSTTSTHPPFLRVPQDFHSIQSAVDFAVDGDVIIISPGVYVENIVIPGKAITLRNIDPEDPKAVSQTVVDGAASGSVVRIIGRNPNEIVFAGLTIKRGSSLNGGAVFIDEGAKVGLIKNHIIENWAAEAGGGVFWGPSASGMMKHNLIQSNRAKDGGGIFSYSTAPIRLEGNFITENLALSKGGGVALISSAPLITGNMILSNTAALGGGIAISGIPPTLIHNRIIGNYATQNGGGLYLQASETLWGLLQLDTNLIFSNPPNRLYLAK